MLWSAYCPPTYAGRSKPYTLGMLAVLLTDCDGDFHKEREGYCCLQKVHYLPISVAAEHIQPLKNMQFDPQC